MNPRTALEIARQCLRLDPLWWAPLVERYGVSARTCYELGKRTPGRRPTFPRGPIGMTYDEIWHARPRSSPSEIAQFYADLGSWPVFRQAYRRRYYAWPDLLKDLPHGARLVEYGCGIAPATFWLSRRRSDFKAILVDVPGEAIDFASWRLKRYGFDHVQTHFVTSVVPILPTAEVVIATEVLEHVPSPVAVMQTLLGSLRPGGILYEDFHRHSEPSPADLDTARVERDEVYRMIRAACPVLWSGKSPDEPDGGGMRRWQKSTDGWSKDGDR